MKIQISNYIFIIILAFSACNERKEQSTSKENNSKTEDQLFSEMGSYLGYEYILMNKDNKIVVTFPKRFLPRDDDIVVGAIKSVIAKSYNEILTDKSKATIEQRNGIGLIKLNGKKTNYYVQIIKEDTGEVHSFILWGENK